MTPDERVSDDKLLAKLIDYDSKVASLCGKNDCTCLCCLRARFLRELAQRRSAGWVKWKPGDALPADGLYWVTRHWEIDGRQMVDTSYAHSTNIDDWEYVGAPVVAYWSEPLPPPFEQEDMKP